MANFPFINRICEKPNSRSQPSGDGSSSELLVGANSLLSTITMVTRWVAYHCFAPVDIHILIFARLSSDPIPQPIFVTPPFSLFDSKLLKTFAADEVVDDPVGTRGVVM